MKKIFLSVMIVAVSVFAFDLSAQNKECKKEECKKENCDKMKSCKKARKAPCPFEGLNLTADQQAKLKALKAPAKSKEEMMKHRQNRDSLARAAKAKHLAEIKAILTPEQYVQYLENIALQKNKGKVMNHARKHRGDKMKKHGNCPKQKCCPSQEGCKKQ